MDEKERVYGERYPIDEDFLAALAKMPPASGVALGLDRLVMLATGAPHIDLVQWTPVAQPARSRTDERHDAGSLPPEVALDRVIARSATRPTSPRARTGCGRTRLAGAGA